MKFRAWIVLLALLATGCSSVFVYNRLDTLLAWYLEGLVTLDKSQRADLRAWLDQTLQWHRDSELERYAEFVRSLSDAAASGATRTAFEEAERRFRSFTAHLAERSAPEAARILADLSDAQVQELIQSLEDKSQERLHEEQDLVERDKWHDRRAKQITRQVMRWTGDVEADQKKLIRDTAERLQPSYPEWLESQRAWRKAVQAALSMRGEDAELAQRDIMSLLTSLERYWTDAYRSKLAHNREQMLSLLVSLDARLTSRQRGELRTRLSKLADELEVLASTPEEPS